MPLPNGLGAGPSKGMRPSSREGGSAEGVGEESIQGAQGFHVGLAPSHLRPPKGIDSGVELVCHDILLTKLVMHQCHCVHCML